MAPQTFDPRREPISRPPAAPIAMSLPMLLPLFFFDTSRPLLVVLTLLVSRPVGDAAIGIRRPFGSSSAVKSTLILPGVDLSAGITRVTTPSTRVPLGSDGSSTLAVKRSPGRLWFELILLFSRTFKT